MTASALPKSCFAASREEEIVRVGICLPEARTGESSVTFSSAEDIEIRISENAPPSFSIREGSVTLSAEKNGGLTVKTEGGEALTISSDISLFLSGKSGELTVKTSAREFPCPGTPVCSVVGGQLKVILLLDLEAYTKCVMANEIGTRFSAETRRAFSLLVRTVALHGRKHQDAGADVCATTCCQVFLGNYRRHEENDAIVDSTRGQYLTYLGQPISCPYHHSNGGATCSAAAAWGGSGAPYLMPVFLEETEPFAGKTWEYTFTAEELSKKSAFSSLSGTLLALQIRERDPYGSSFVTLLTAADGMGNTIVLETSQKIRGALGLPSGNFDLAYGVEQSVIGEDGVCRTQELYGYVDAHGNYVPLSSFSPLSTTEGAPLEDIFLRIRGKGEGHGVGFSAVGAEKLSAEGMGYREILQFFFPGTEIEYLLNGF